MPIDILYRFAKDTEKDFIDYENMVNFMDYAANPVKLPNGQALVSLENYI